MDGLLSILTTTGSERKEHGVDYGAWSKCHKGFEKTIELISRTEMAE